MTEKEKHIYEWANQAVAGLDKQWAPCDRDTGKECQGIRCWMAEHRAMVYLMRIIEEIN